MSAKSERPRWKVSEERYQVIDTLGENVRVYFLEHIQCKDLDDVVSTKEICSALKQPFMLEEFEKNYS